MKIEVSLKDPDGFWECVNSEVRDAVLELNLSKSDTDALVKSRLDDAWEKLEKWVEYKEYLRVSFDLETGTATVLENK